MPFKAEAVLPDGVVYAGKAEIGAQGVAASAQIRLVHFRTPEAASPQIGTREVGLIQFCPPEVGAVQVSVKEISPFAMGIAEIRMQGLRAR